MSKEQTVDHVEKGYCPKCGKKTLRPYDVHTKNIQKGRDWVCESCGIKGLEWFANMSGSNGEK